MKPLVVAGPEADASAPFFSAAGFELRRPPVRAAEQPAAYIVRGPSARVLADADAHDVRYTLVHVGSADAEVGGSWERAHHRVPLAGAAEVAGRLRPRERPLVTCMAFAYKKGVPEDATLLVDVRFLDNPYWDVALRELTGRDRPVADHVLGQPAALELLERMESTLRWLLPLYQRDHLVVAFGCTGGRHRSVALASEMARRLASIDSIDVELVTRDLDPGESA